MPSPSSNKFPALVYAPCTGGGRSFMAPGSVIAVTYNGIFLPRGAAAPKMSFGAAGNLITLNFDPETGGRIDALCITTPS